MVRKFLHSKLDQLAVRKDIQNRENWVSQLIKWCKVGERSIQEIWQDGILKTTKRLPICRKKKIAPRRSILIKYIKESDNPENIAILTMGCANKDDQDKAVEHDHDNEASEDDSIVFF
ncbi:hypothetical protein ILUMI_20619, partial [Ignelater luminosus]